MTFPTPDAKHYINADPIGKIAWWTNYDGVPHRVVILAVALDDRVVVQPISNRTFPGSDNMFLTTLNALKYD